MWKFNVILLDLAVNLKNEENNFFKTEQKVADFSGITVKASESGVNMASDTARGPNAVSKELLGCGSVKTRG